MKFKRDQFVRLTYCGETIDAVVILASPDSRRLLLGFKGTIGIDGSLFTSSMPVLQEDDGRYFDLTMQRRSVTIEQHSIALRSPPIP